MIACMVGLEVLDTSGRHAGGADHAVKILDVKEGVVSATLVGHSKKVTALTFAGDSVVVSGSADKTVKAWRKDADDTSKWTVGYSFETPASVVQVMMPPRLHACTPQHILQDLAIRDIESEYSQIPLTRSRTIFVRTSRSY